MITRGTTLEQLNAIGRKVGLTLYYDSSETIKLRAGLLHINDGTRNNVITVSDEIDLSSYTFGSGSATYPTSVTNNQTWVYVTIDINGVLRLRLSTGTNATTNTERPDDSYYAWAGYEHMKGGYYYSSTERIIGVIYRNDSATSWYVINQGSEADEEGENDSGYWIKKDSTLIEFGDVVISLVSSTSGGQTVSFINTFSDTPSVTGTIDNGAFFGAATSVTTSDFHATCAHFDTNTAPPFTFDFTYYYHAIGKWRA